MQNEQEKQKYFHLEWTNTHHEFIHDICFAVAQFVLQIATCLSCLNLFSFECERNSMYKVCWSRIIMT